ncbi:hypothetical protein SAMN02800692_1550 [Luteibacter sp. UNC138MFCol5.1]|nr:hypothetical protein [Luteibacter sp. UNC138MFCol5.1]SEO64073.1 hypothetical protein SAMN02800692_1550 [Luteibacter sp. UNC138MFCol5.1]
MTDFEIHLAQIGEHAQAHRPMTRRDWLDLAKGLGLPLLGLLALIAFCGH